MRARERRSIGIASVGGVLAVLLAGTAPSSAAATLATASPLRAGAPLAAQAVAGAVPFAQSSFTGYASGHEVGVGALNLGNNTQAAGLVQAFSGASSVSPGGSLAGAIVGDDGGVHGTGLLVQPTEPNTVKAFGTGIGASLGLAAAADGSANQLKVAGQATQVAPPNSAAVTSSLPNASGLSLPAGLANASALTGRGSAFYDALSCPLGQPLGYGLGDAAGASLLDFSQLGASNPLTSVVGGLLPSGLLTSIPGLSIPTTGSLISTSGAGDEAAESDSETFLSANGDGTYGYTTQAREVIAPVTVNLFGAAQIQITISGSATALTPAPVTLTAKTTGESTGASVTLAANDFVGINLITTVPTTTTTPVLPPTSLQTIIGKGGETLDFNPSTLVAQAGSLISSLLPGTPATPLLNTLGGVVGTIGQTVAGATGATPLDVSFGSVSIGTPVRAINSSPTAAMPPLVVGGTQASGAVNILSLHLGLSAPATSPLATVVASAPQLADIADLSVGHLEASATDNAPITCTIPVIKSANPTSLAAGHDFTYTIEVPNPAEIEDLSCSLANVTANDVISDAQGQPTFDVIGVSNGGVVSQSSPNHATINWAGLSYTVAPVGAAPNPPITLTITVSTPSSSPAGIIQDMVTASGTASGCNGGVTGIADLGGVDGNVLTGSYTLQQPSVTAVPAAAAAPPAATAAPPQGALPHTGGTGGLWQPIGGLVVLGLGGGAVALLRRSRRRLS